MSDSVTDPEQVPVAVAMARVMRDIGAIGKTRRNEQQNYSFRGIDELMDALHPVMVRHGVFVVPCGADHKYIQHERTTQRGTASVSTQVFLVQRYRFYGPMGDSIDAEVSGEGADTADKATNKASAGAFKYLLLQSFTIPLRDMEDGDRETPEITRTSTRPRGGATRAQTDRSSSERAPSAARVKARDGLRETIAGLPDEVRAQVATYLNEHRINLKNDVPEISTMRAITAYIDTLGTATPEQAEG